MLSNTTSVATAGEYDFCLYENPCNVTGIDVVAGSEMGTYGYI